MHLNVAPVERTAPSGMTKDPAESAWRAARIGPLESVRARGTPHSSPRRHAERVQRRILCAGVRRAAME